MAQYSYECSHCRQTFAVEKSMALSGREERCPQCQAPANRVYTAPGIRIKGAKVAFSGCGLGEESASCQSCRCAGECSTEA
jgi:putative FmdB family regulatory protein